MTSQGKSRRTRKRSRRRGRLLKRYPWHVAAAVAVLFLCVALFARKGKIDLAPSLPLEPEAAWVPAHPSDRWTCIVIHHSATASGDAAIFDRAHRTERNFDELGYHFVIGNGSPSGDGQIEVGPRWPAQKHGAHCKTDDGYYNDHGIGICLVGNFDVTDPTPAQLNSLNRLVRHLCRAHGIPADRVYTHGGVTGKTHCPGAHFDVDRVRAAIGSTTPGS